MKYKINFKCFDSIYHVANYLGVNIETLKFAMDFYKIYDVSYHEEIIPVDGHYYNTTIKIYDFYKHDLFIDLDLHFDSYNKMVKYISCKLNVDIDKVVFAINNKDTIVRIKKLK